MHEVFVNENKLDKAPISPYIVSLLEMGLREVRNKTEAEELACLVIDMSKDKAFDTMKRISEILLLRAAIILAVQAGAQVKSFEELFRFYENYSLKLIDDRQWEIFENNTSARFRETVLAGLWARFRYLGIARAQDFSTSIVINFDPRT